MTKVADGQTQQKEAVRLKPYQTLDAWRGIASLWVVLFHASSITGVLFPDLFRTPLFVFGSRGSLGVQMFFVISGYCIASAAGSATHHQHGFWKFMRARFQRIYPAYWCAFLLSMILAAVAFHLAASGHLQNSYLRDHDPMHQGWLYAAANAVLLQAPLQQSYLLIVSWTLCYEVFFYLVIGVGVLCAKGRGETFLLNLLHALTAAALLGLIFVPQYRLFPFDLWPQFGLGVLVYDWLRHEGQQRPRLWAIGIAALLLAFVMRWDFLIGSVAESSRLTFSWTLIFAAALLGLHRLDLRLARVPAIRGLSAIGLFSYSLYLIHMLCLGLLNQVVRHVHLPHALAYAWLFLSLLLALAAGRVFYHFCERPFLKGNRAAKLESAATKL